MQTSQRALLLIAGLSSLLALRPSPLLAEEPDTEESEPYEAIIQQILELRQQVEDLVEVLPEEMRQELEARWHRAQAERETDRGVSQAEEATHVIPQKPDAVKDSMGESSLGEPTEEIPPVVALEIEEEPSLEEPEEATPAPCGGFHLFDTNQDALISGGDRPWRFLRLWFDADGDGEVAESEIESLFELGVRQIDVALRFYNTAEGNSEDVDVEDFIWLRAVGRRKGGGRSGVLVIDADRIASDGRLRISDTQSGSLSGFQPLGADTILQTEEGGRYPLICPSVS